MSVINYPYKDPKNMNAFQVINEGDGFFKILKIEDKLSRAGDPMTVITYSLKDLADNKTLYLQYLVHNEYLPDNIYRICEAIGKAHLYSKNGTDTKELLGGMGKCKIRTESSDQYGESSKLHKFIPFKPMLEEGEIVTKINGEWVPDSAVSDDELPF